MKSALEGRIQRAEEIANTLKHFKREVALSAEHSKSGKPISQKLLADMEATGKNSIILGAGCIDPQSPCAAPSHAAMPQHPAAASCMLQFTKASLAVTIMQCCLQLSTMCWLFVCAERALEEEVQRVRLKNIHLGNALKKLESTIRHKEQLAGEQAASLHSTVQPATVWPPCPVSCAAMQHDMHVGRRLASEAVTSACSHGISTSSGFKVLLPGCAVAEGLHLIDFEQLKIENQSLNEKIEERNEELVKLRKKTTVTVQVRNQRVHRQTSTHAIAAIMM